METSRSLHPDLKFLKFIRKICSKKKIILIFDLLQVLDKHMEGSENLYNLKPDLAVFGKSLGNGFVPSSGKKK